jgi:hypothetical protein
VVRGRNTQARNRTNRSTVAAAFARTITAQPEPENDQTLELVAGGAVAPPHR